MNLGTWLERTARHDPDRPALFLGQDQVATYGQFHHRAGQVAAWLESQGIQPGDRVGIFMKNVPDYLVVLYGIWYAGAAAVPINAKLHGREARFILENSGTRLTFATGELVRALTEAGVTSPVLDTNNTAFAESHAAARAAPIHCAPDDLAWLFYTSGTTGRPKGVMITHQMLVTMSLCYQSDVDHVYPDDAILYAAPMSHGAGIYNMVHVLAGARHVCPTSGGFDPAEIFDLARHHGAVQMFAAPTMIRRMTDAAKEAGVTGEGLRTVAYGGGPMYLADIIEAEIHFGPIFVQIYGQGECPMAITVLPRTDVSDREHPDWRSRLASIGRAQSAVEVRIGAPDGSRLPPGEHGEIMVRGETVMPGYWDNPDATAKTLIDGWLMTGDMGFMDVAGYVTLQDRSKDMIISGGSNIYPREVEEVLLTHPKVNEASVVSRAHPDWGEEVVAFVVGSATPDQLDKLCTENIARFKRPKAYVFVPELPKNNYGKVLKTELRKRLEEQP